jgi:hypothetical protein
MARQTMDVRACSKRGLGHVCGKERGTYDEGEERYVTDSDGSFGGLQRAMLTGFRERHSSALTMLVCLSRYGITRRCVQYCSDLSRRYIQ